MGHQKISEHAATIPFFDFGALSSREGSRSDLFLLPSHARARAALDQGIQTRKRGYNIFIIGEEGSNRLQSTLAYLTEASPREAYHQDWVYVYNFAEENHAIPLAFPVGQGKTFQSDVGRAVDAIQHNLTQRLQAPDMVERLQGEKTYVEEEIEARLDDLRRYAQDHGLDLNRLEDGAIIVVEAEDEEGEGGEKQKSSRKETPESLEYKQASARQHLHQEVKKLTAQAFDMGERLYQRIEKIRQKAANSIVQPCLKKVKEKYQSSAGVAEWLLLLEEDMVRYAQYLAKPDSEESQAVLARYQVNLFVTHTSEDPWVQIATPTYDQLFGSLQYRTTSQGMMTDFTLAQAGAVHQANGGILMLRAEALAKHPDAWEALKQVMRTQKLFVGDRGGHQGRPIEHPKFDPIPLDLQIILVGAPSWYYSFFYNDASFKSFFKIKADIEPYFSKSKEAMQLYARCLQRQAQAKLGKTCTKEALSYLLGYSTRLSGHRERISTRIDTLTDLLVEANYFTNKAKRQRIQLSDIIDAIQARDYRNDRLKDQLHQHFHEGLMMIETAGEKVGQINALTVQTVGSDSFGAPARVTAQTAVGEKGIINIEHVVELGGPIQHKGVLGVEGYLRGVFAQEFPLSFDCSLTFEQNYSGVEGDSASLAEACAILSSLAERPLRQDVAITGSINQFGVVQAVGGINEKIEGFFYICQARGLSGTQGVIIPSANRSNVALIPEVSDAIAKGRFHLWSVDTVADALTLLTAPFKGGEANRKDIFKLAFEKLKRFHGVLTQK